MKNLSSTGSSPKKVAQGLSGFAGAIFVAGAAAAFALNSQINSVNTRANAREAEVGSSEQVTRRYQLTQDSYNDTVSQIHNLEASVSQSTYVPTLLQQLQTLAASTHLTVSAVRPLPPAPTPPVVASADGASKKKKIPPPYDTLDISVDVKGTYANTASFLYSLTRFPKIVSVTSAQMRPNPPEPGQNPLASPTVATSLHLTAYVFHDDSVAPAGPATAPAVATNVSTPVTSNAQTATFVGAANRTIAGAVGVSKASAIRNSVDAPTL